MVLVSHIRHGEFLEKKIPGSVFVKGEDGEDVRKMISDFDKGKIPCLIGSPVVGEGIDIPSADALVYAKGCKARVTHTQDVFRVLTADGKKKNALIVDFADRHNRYLMSHSVERMKNYLSMQISVDIRSSVVVNDDQSKLKSFGS